MLRAGRRPGASRRRRDLPRDRFASRRRLARARVRGVHRGTCGPVVASKPHSSAFTPRRVPASSPLRAGLAVGSSRRERDGAGVRDRPRSPPGSPARGSPSVGGRRASTPDQHTEVEVRFEPVGEPRPGSRWNIADWDTRAGRSRGAPPLSRRRLPAPPRRLVERASGVAAKGDGVSRASIDVVRSLALALPEVEESQLFGTPDFRVRGKIFATARHGEGICMLKLPASHPGGDGGDPARMFSACRPAAGPEHGATYADTDKIDPDLLKDLLELAAAANVAPKKLAATHEPNDPRIAEWPTASNHLPAPGSRGLERRSRRP